MWCLTDSSSGSGSTAVSYAQELALSCSGDWHYIIPEYKCTARMDRLLGAWMDGSVAPVTSVHRARARARARTMARLGLGLELGLGLRLELGLGLWLQQGVPLLNYVMPIPHLPGTCRICPRVAKYIRMFLYYSHRGARQRSTGHH